ncbi:hypothetical protein N7U49_01615 [Streptomyces sp. AD2-2]|nr:hypothetical protein N7U49_01615 [Streptomyces sp. AD2-2]
MPCTPTSPPPHDKIAAPDRSAQDPGPREPTRPSAHGSKTAATQDAVEDKLKKAVCAGTVTLTDAQDSIVTDWTTGLSDLGLS